MTDQSRSSEGESKGSFLSGWRKALLWVAGAAILGVVGYRGALGTEVAAGAVSAASAAAATSGPATAAASAAGREAPHLHTSSSTGGSPSGAHDRPRSPAREALTPGDSEPGSAPASARPATSAAPPGAPAIQGTAETGPGGASSANTDASGPPAAAVTADGRIVLNLASESELRRLPGIGRSRARAIIEQRERLGRFRRLEDLLRVKGIGPRRLATLRPKLVLDAP